MGFILFGGAIFLFMGGGGSAPKPMPGYIMPLTLREVFVYAYRQFISAKQM